jgi:hypothetical protein
LRPRALAVKTAMAAAAQRKNPRLITKISRLPCFSPDSFLPWNQKIQRLPNGKKRKIDGKKDRKINIKQQ